MSIKTPEAIALATSEEFGYPINPSPGTITDMLVAAIEADREQIIRDMAAASHKDDWGVPCVYVATYAKRLTVEMPHVR